MALKTTLNAKNLEALGAERLAALLIEISTGSAASKRRLRLELAGAQSMAEVSREVRKRLSSIERSKTIVNWRKIKALQKDLETQREVIVGTIAVGDPDEAMELLWRFLELASTIFARCEDSKGTILACFHAACRDLGSVAKRASRNGRLPEQAFSALSRNENDECSPLIEALAPALGTEGLEQLKSLLEEWGDELAKPQKGRRAMARGGGGGAGYNDEIYRRHSGILVRRALEQVADALGDVDAYIAQQPEEAIAMPRISAAIARRLLKAGRLPEALAALEAAAPSRSRQLMGYEWQETKCAVLDALGRPDEAQAFRWSCFEQLLSPDHLRAYLKRLPDFDDMEAEEKALTFVAGVSNAHLALYFLVAWPALDRAARLVIDRTSEISGNAYEELSPAAEALQDRYPLAATILLRAAIDHTLDYGRVSRQRHAAHDFVICAGLATRIEDFGKVATHAEYDAKLRRTHGSKRSFWAAVGS